MSGPGWTDGRTGGDFAGRLRELKGSGSAVLVTGGGSRAAHGSVARRLLGEGSDARRVLAVTDGTFGVDGRLPLAEDEAAATITAATTRSAAARPAAPTAPSETGCLDREVASLAELGVALADAGAAVERDHGPLEPTELRVAVDSLAPLLDTYGERQVFRFLVLATAYVRAVDALGHVHLPVDRGAYAAGLLAPLFDAVVEVRVDGGRIQQRWHLDGGAVSSRWLDV